MIDHTDAMAVAAARAVDAVVLAVELLVRRQGEEHEAGLYVALRRWKNRKLCLVLVRVVCWQVERNSSWVESCLVEPYLMESCLVEFCWVESSWADSSWADRVV